MVYSLIQRYSIAFILHQKPSFPISYLCLLLLPLATAWFIRNIFFRLFLPHCHFSYFIKKYAGRQRFYLSCGKLFLLDGPFLLLVLKISENTDISYPKEHQEYSTASQARLQLMMQFIHLNYSRSISLDDIAKQAMVSKSTALNLFRKYLHITPVNYLINYRLKQAGQLLSKTEKKVSLISSETGFHNVNYFCRLFKKRYKLTPTEYRKQKHFL